MYVFLLNVDIYVHKNVYIRYIFILDIYICSNEYIMNK